MIFFMFSGKSNSNIAVSWDGHMILKYSNTQQIKESIAEKIISHGTYDEYCPLLV